MSKFARQYAEKMAARAKWTAFYKAKRKGRPAPSAPPPPPSGVWCVMRVNDDGRLQVAVANVSMSAAEELAGQRRDRSTEQEIGEGWNYLPRRQPRSGSEAIEASPKSFSQPTNTAMGGLHADRIRPASGSPAKHRRAREP